MLKNRWSIIFSFSTLFILCGCDSNILSKLKNPAENRFVSGTTGTYVLYGDDLLTTGGIQLIPGGENQYVNFEDRSDPQRTRNQMVYEWNGGPISNTETDTDTITFAGIQFIDGFSGVSTNTTALDLTGPGYTKLTFWARGTLAHGVTLQVSGPDDGSVVGGVTPASITLSATTTPALTNAWQQFTVTVPSGDFANVRIFFTATLIYDVPPPIYKSWKWRCGLF